MCVVENIGVVERRTWREAATASAYVLNLNFYYRPPPSTLLLSPFRKKYINTS